MTTGGVLRANASPLEIVELNLQLEDLFSVKTMKIVLTNNSELGLLECLVNFQYAVSVDDLGSRP